MSDRIMVPGGTELAQDLARNVSDVALARLSRELGELEFDVHSRKAGRFRDRRGMATVRRVCGWLSDHLPTVAAHVGYKLISTPPRFHLPFWQRELADKARKVRLSFAGSHITKYEWGNGESKLLLVNGWGSHATHMGKMVPRLLEAGYRVIAFDPPAHGRSGGRTTDLVQFAAAINRVAQSVGGVDHLIAHSFGSAMALYAKRDWGTAFRSQVLISPFHDCLWFIEAFGQHVGIKPAVLSTMRRWMSERHGGRVDWNRLSLPDMLRETGGRTLLIHDEEDLEVPVTHSLAIHEAVPATEIQLTRGFGHHRILGSAAVMEGVIRFLRATAEVEDGRSDAGLRNPDASFDTEGRFC